MKHLNMLADAGATVKGAERLASQIEHLIDEQGFEPGHHIGTKKALCESSGMALASVNEALRLLESRGRVTVRSGPGGGVFVAEPSPSVRLGQAVLAVSGSPRALADAIALRDVLEPIVAGEAAEARGDGDIAEMRALIAEMAASIDDEKRYGEANFRLHARIAEACSNVFVRAVYSLIVRFVLDKVETVRTPASLAYRVQRQKLHEDLVAAIARGDAAEARRIARKHAHRAVPTDR